MEWKNNLEESIKESLKITKAIKPDAKILEKAGTSEVRFRMLLNNEVKMNAWEAVVFAEWLQMDVNQIVSPFSKN